jgi:23S rRNA pseudouridine1911/1915/1917 synthase
MNKEILINKEDPGNRLDRFLAGEMPELSRSFIAKLIDEGSILVNGQKSKPSYVLKEGDKVLVETVLASKVAREVKPLEANLDILYEDEGILVINKPAGLVVHPAVGHEEDTLVNVLAYLRPNLRALDSERLGIVHRLDKETSGVMVVAKSPKALKSLYRQIADRKIKKHYKEIVFGHLETKSGKIEVPIKRLISDRMKMGVSVIGRKAVTQFKVETEYPNFSLVNAYPVTGRTHQIRVHFAYLGHPILGDKLYSSRNKQKEAEEIGVKRHMLHAFKLGLINPTTLKWQEFEASLPEDFIETVERISN